VENWGDGGFDDRLEGPVFGAETVIAGVGFVDRNGGGVDGPGGTIGDPLTEIGDLGGGEERAFLGHAAAWVGVLDAGEEEAPGRVAGDDGGAGVAAAEYAVVVIDAEISRGFGFGGMAGVAVVDEDRADLFLEELNLSGRGGERGRGEQEQCGFHGVSSFLPEREGIRRCR
jgi:hypothetical protein